MRRLLRAASVAAAAVTLAGCGLPLPSGVQLPGRVAAEQPRAADIVVLPPGPAPGATPRDLVEHFLGAQSSPEGRHAVARQFLTPAADRKWDDEAGVQVYDSAQPLVIEQTANPEIVTVTARTAATLSADGVYQRVSRELTDTYRVACTAGTCRIAALADGLRLDRNDLVRSFAPRSVHFLAPAYSDATSSGHLVADLVWLPRTVEAGRLVQAVLDGPSTALRGSVTTAVPAGTRLVRPVATSPDGTVTVDLSAQARGLAEPGREQLSAQLVWTLRNLRTGFTGLRLQVEGSPFAVAGSTAVQDARAWAAYDPERLRPRAPAFYLDGRQLRSLVDGGLSTSPATEGQLPVDVAAASPDGFLALLTTRPDGSLELRTGPQAGPFDTVRARGALASPTWGSGEQGLFLLREGRVVLLPQRGDLVGVPVEGLDAPVRRIRVARDGVRVALLVGARDDLHLMVGRLTGVSGRVRVVGLREVAPTLPSVVDVAWESGTSMVVLATFPLGLLPGRVAADGYTTDPPLLGSRLPQGLTPVSITAADGRPIVLEGTVGGQSRLYRDNGQLFADQVPGRAPFYPG